ncbi:hypothetical protein OIU84_011755 [Salix udensis]|uniref:Uncharacterized protein n=1 Tax=Salix udensis TaxID=889485 RepID=A0AAD6JPB8_9ROSI|nr:hypothetical protein OIU84_011755 [Salix udensis]
MELSAANEELAASKSQLQDIERRLSSKEALISELTQELDLKKASESQAREDFSALENLLTATKEDLQSKVSEMEGMKLELQEEITTRESVEAGLKTHEAQVSTVQEELAKVLKEKEALVAAMADLTSNAAQMKELCSELEGKLKTSEENFCKTDSLLSQALSTTGELEQKLKFLEDLHSESRAAAATASQKNLELEDLIQASSDAAEEAKSQLRELEIQFIAAEKKSVEFEQQLNMVEQKSSDAEREAREFSEKISELSTALKEVEGEKNQLSSQMEEYQEKIRHLESSMNQSSSRNSELEEELKIAKEQCAGHEDRAKMHYQRSLELEDLFQTSHSRLEDAGKKAREFALLLEAEKYRIKELEEQNSASERKCVDAEADSRKYSDKISELASEIEVYQAKSSSLEVSLQMAGEKEKELTELLNLVTDEKKRLEEASSSSNEKLTEAENLVGVLRNELTVMQEKLESIENDLKAAGLKESDMMAKLNSAEEQLEQQEKLLEEATTRKSELESLHETLKRDSEIKLQEALTNFSNKDSEAESLSEKLNTLENQVKAYKEQITEVTGRSAVLKEELDLCLLRMVALETSNEELKSQIVEAETKFSNSYSDNELLVETNNQLKSKIDELQELLNSAVSEKEVTSQQLASHANTITEITDKHSRAIELHSATESRMMRAEMQLQEAIHSLILKDVETKDLNEKLNAHEGQVKLFEEQSHEASTIADSRKTELEETLLKVTHLETVVEELKTKSDHFERESGGLAEDNLKLTQEVASYESKLRDLEAKLSAILSEKDGTVEQLHISKKAVDDLRLQLTDEGQKLQSQISSVMEENNLLNETYQHEKKELQSVIIQLEEQLKGKKASEDALNSGIESLKAEVAERSALQTSLEELEKQLMTAEAQLKEQKEIDSQKLEKEAALKKSLADLEAKNKETSHLENQVKELEQKLREADAKLLEKGDGSSPSEQKGGEIKSRDIGAAISTPTKRKSKKKLEAASTQVSSPSETHTQTADVWPAMNFKFILGVALVSLIIGAILGKRY